ncbi:MAG TPA: hypothetical protein VK601_19560, partial [Kofleriaceae bacterium]|nr:hypothetical protein [Kofleriaceae bacterium]
MPDAPEIVATAEQAVITQCPYLDPLDPNFYAGPPVSFGSEILITSVAVVDDPCRTTWTGSCAGGGTQGIWTFGELMIRMAGTGAPDVLAAEWLHQWEIPIVVNGFLVPPRPAIRSLVIDPWLLASGCAPGLPITGPGACKLDLKKAPFRLLAISNRVDLECAGYTGAGDGEARFVFGMLDSGGNPLRAAVIFEYKLPPQRGGAPYTAATWENDWHALSTMAIGSPPYKTVLQGILNDVTKVGALPGGPNLGTSIGQVRTNELDLGGAPWKLREAHLIPGSGIPGGDLLLATTTAETPDDSMNTSGPLDSYLASNAALLATFQQKPIPPPLAGGESSAPLTTPPAFWNHSSPSPLAPIERHHFGFNTCNGCHSLETTTGFLHVGVRSTGSPAPLSPFLSTSTAAGGGGLPSSALVVTDPAGTGATFKYNEPWRRLCEASR